MKKNLKYIVLVTVMIVTNVLTFAVSSNAEEGSAGGATGFIYEILKPENQKSDSGYFDLKMEAGQKQRVQILLKNPSDKELTVEAKLNGAKTNMNGVIEYGPTKLKKDASLKYDFVDVVKAPETIVLPPKSEKPLDIEIAMPETSYDGVIVGGIQLKKADSKEDEDKQKGTNVINKYAYVIAMVLNETDAIVKPQLELNKVEAGQANYRNVIYTNVSNTAANFLDNLSMEVQVSTAKSDEVLYETKKSSMRMAPNSNMTFPVSMQGEKMIPGKYRAHILATSGKEKWEWDEEFEITNEQADKFNRADVGLVQEKGINWPLVVGAAVGVFIVILIIFLIIHSIRKKSAAKKRANRRKASKEGNR